MDSDVDMDAFTVEHRRLESSGSVPVVTSLLLSGDRIITSSDDGVIRVFSFERCALVHVLHGHTGGVWTLDVLSDTLVSGSTDCNVRVWDLQHGECTHILEGHTSTVRCVKISKPAEGTSGHPLIVSGSRDCNLRVWRLPDHGDDDVASSPDSSDSDDTLDFPHSPYHKFLLEGHTAPVRGLDVHGDIAVSGSYDFSVRVWDIEKGELMWNMEGHTAKVYCVAYDPLRKQAYSGSMDSTVRVWNVENGQCIHVLSASSLVGLISISPNNLVAGSADAVVRVWDPDTGELKHALTSHNGAILCIAHDDDKIISASDDNLRLTSIRDGQVRDMKLLSNEVYRTPWQVALDGERCVAATSTSDNKSSSIDIWTLRGFGEEQRDNDGDTVVHGFVVVLRPSTQSTSSEA